MLLQLVIRKLKYLKYIKKLKLAIIVVTRASFLCSGFFSINKAPPISSNYVSSDVAFSISCGDNYQNNKEFRKKAEELEEKNKKDILSRKSFFEWLRELDRGGIDGIR